ncbi:hypothetical protein ACE1N8_13035 [Streptomyces sp. DSM 116494]|uniref:hypothetical protein n=1 Tax=Streptomyces okerensis TaxID=3344655 RepID=UPI00388E78B7
MATSFMVNTVASLPARRRTRKVRKATLSAASDLLYLTGYMAVNEGLHGLAQHYYIQVLELEGSAEDHLTYCITLRGMSVQAVGLRHGAKAVELADAASAASPQAGPRMRAFLADQPTHPAAEAGDRSGALRYIRKAEAAMDRAESREKASGSYESLLAQLPLSQYGYRPPSLTSQNR